MVLIDVLNRISLLAIQFFLIVNAYCRFVNFHKPFISIYEFCEYHSVCKSKVARYNASAAYENRTPDVTLAKLDDLNVRL